MTPDEKAITELIKSNGLTPSAEAGDFAGIATALNAATIEVVNTTEYSLQMIGERCGEILGSVQQGLLARRKFADTLADAIAAKVSGWGELQAAQIALGNGLLTLHGADRQATIDALGTEWPAPIRDAIKSLGVRMLTPAEHAGLPPVTAADVQAAWEAAQVKATVKAASAGLDALYNAWRAGDAAALATINTVAAEVTS